MSLETWLSLTAIAIAVSAVWIVRREVRLAAAPVTIVFYAETGDVLDELVLPVRTTREHCRSLVGMRLILASLGLEQFEPATRRAMDSTETVELLAGKHDRFLVRVDEDELWAAKKIMWGCDPYRADRQAVSHPTREDGPRSTDGGGNG